MRTRAFAVGTAVVLAIATAGCSAAGATQPSAGASTEVSQRSAAPVVTAVISGPPRPCGIHTAREVRDLIESGIAVALIETTVTEQPTHSGRNMALPIGDYTVLAGNLDSGQAKVVTDAPGAGQNSLPPGNYAILLGHDPAQAAGSYYLGFGQWGSFAIVGTQAIQRCPSDDSAVPTDSARQALSVSALTEYAKAAFADRQ